jgi:hypothetical protein
MENKEFVSVLFQSFSSVEHMAALLQLATNLAAFGAKIDFS